MRSTENEDRLLRPDLIYWGELVKVLKNRRHQNIPGKLCFSDKMVVKYQRLPIDCGVFVLSASFLWFMEGSWRNEQQFRVHFWIWKYKTIIGRNDKKAIRSFQCFSFLVCVCAHTPVFLCLSVGGLCLLVWFLFPTENSISRTQLPYMENHGTENFSGVNQENKGACPIEFYTML